MQIAQDGLVIRIWMIEDQLFSGEIEAVVEEQKDIYYIETTSLIENLDNSKITFAGIFYDSSLFGTLSTDGITVDLNTVSDIL